MEARLVDEPSRHDLTVPVKGGIDEPWFSSTVMFCLNFFH